MSQFLSMMLLGDVPRINGRGRSVKLSGNEIDLKLITGSPQAQLLYYLGVVDIPASAKEVAEGIGSESNKANRILKKLVIGGEVEMI